MRSAHFLALRAIHSSVLIAAATLLVFVLLRLIPGDPAEAMLGELATPQSVAALQRTLGLDQPLPIQYAKYVGRLVRGDFGTSIRYGRPVLDVVSERLAATATLAAAATAIALVIGIPLGIAAATRRRWTLDGAAFVVSLVGQAMPAYWLGLILIYVFAVSLRWLPVSGNETPLHLVLPAVTLAAFMIGVNVRLTRSVMLEVMSEDYIRTARAKGLAERVVIGRHALRLVLIHVVTVVGLQIGSLLGGAVVTETIFAWPGVGSLVALAIAQRDYPIVQALVLLSAVTFIVLNLLVDFVYAFLDPRLTHG